MGAVEYETDLWQSDEARARWRTLLDHVEHDGEHITIARWNKPAAVIVPVAWYEQAQATLRKDQK